MAGTKRDRQKAMREARRARELALAKARARRRRAVQIGVGTVVALAVVFLLSRGGDDSTDVATEGPTTTVSAPGPDVGSAAGKPCVPVADPLPVGAPAVPVKVGPPPAQLVKEDLKVGTGATVGATDTVTAHYIGVSCSTGKIFDSSYSRNQPIPFSLSGGVITGWTDGIPGMQVGGQRLLGIPPDQAYGDQGRPNIAPGETLWFVVEIVETKAG